MFMRTFRIQNIAKQFIILAFARFSFDAAARVSGYTHPLTRRWNKIENIKFYDFRGLV